MQWAGKLNHDERAAALVPHHRHSPPLPAAQQGRKLASSWALPTGNAVQQHKKRPQAAELPEAAPPTASHQKALQGTAGAPQRYSSPQWVHPHLNWCREDI